MTLEASGGENVYCVVKANTLSREGITMNLEVARLLCGFR